MTAALTLISLSTYLFLLGIITTVLTLTIIGASFTMLGFSWFSRNRKGKGVSIIIPFRPSSQAKERLRNVLWLKQYWETNLPGAEIIIGDDPNAGRVFSKSIAINNAVAKSSGDVLVIVDADGYIAIDHVMYCVDEIRHARKSGRRLWFVPYRQFYRLNEKASDLLLSSDPAKPYSFTDPVDPSMTINEAGTSPFTGHWYGAVIQIVPREGWDIVGGWDQRFCGWGNEDHAAMRAMDTLYWPHKTLPTSVLHIWHPMIGGDGVKRHVNWKDRRWEGQQDPSINNALGYRYYYCMNKPELMRGLVDEWKNPKDECKKTPPSQWGDVKCNRPSV